LAWCHLLWLLRDNRAADHPIKMVPVFGRHLPSGCRLSWAFYDHAASNRGPVANRTSPALLAVNLTSRSAMALVADGKVRETRGTRPNRRSPGSPGDVYGFGSGEGGPMNLPRTAGSKNQGFE